MCRECARNKKSKGEPMEASEEGKDAAQWGLGT